MCVCVMCHGVMGMGGGMDKKVIIVGIVSMKVIEFEVLTHVYLHTYVYP